MSLRLRNPFNFLRSQALAMDMGTGRTRFATPQVDILLDEPTVVALDQFTGAVVAAGTEAKRYLGKAPERIRVVQPVQSGAIVDFDAAAAMLRTFLRQVAPDDGTRLSVCVVTPRCLSPLEQDAHAACLKAAGVRRVDVVDSALAAGVGAGLDVRGPKAQLLLGVGCGLAEATVVGAGEVLRCECAPLGSERFHEAVAAHLTAVHKIAVGGNTAEEVTLRLAWADRPAERREMTVTGKDAGTGTPLALDLDDESLAGALDVLLDGLADLVRLAIEGLPEAERADVADAVLALHGGGALLYGLENALGRRLGFRARLVPTPSYTALRGACAALRQDLDYRSLLIK